MILNGISKEVDKVTANWDGDDAAKLDKLMVVKLVLLNEDLGTDDGDGGADGDVAPLG